MALTGSSKSTLVRRYSRTVGLGSAVITYSITDSSTWIDGDVVGGSQLVYSLNDQAIEGSGGSALSLDLVSALIDPLTGTAQTWTKIKEIFIKNNTTTAGVTLKVNGNFITTVILGGTTPFFTVGPGGEYHIKNPSLAGYAVTATTGDVITLLGGSVTALNIDIIIIGCGTVA